MSTGHKHMLCSTAVGNTGSATGKGKNKTDLNYVRRKYGVGEKETDSCL